MHIQMKRTWGKFCLFFADEKISELSKDLQFCELCYSMCIICIRRRTNIAIEAYVRTITKLYNEPYKNFTRRCLHRKKNKWKRKFVIYVTTILLKSKYLDAHTS